MVSELKMGFSSALMELSQIQHGDSYLREELEENRRSCKKKALRMETLVEALRVRVQLPGQDCDPGTGTETELRDGVRVFSLLVVPAGRTWSDAVPDLTVVQ